MKKIIFLLPSLILIALFYLDYNFFLQYWYVVLGIALIFIASLKIFSPHFHQRKYEKEIESLIAQRKMVQDDYFVEGKIDEVQFRKQDTEIDAKIIKLKSHLIGKKVKKILEEGERD